MGVIKVVVVDVRVVTGLIDGPQLSSVLTTERGIQIGRDGSNGGDFSRILYVILFACCIYQCTTVFTRSVRP